MVRRPRCAPQFNRSLPCPLAIWLACRLRSGRLGGHLAIKPVEKILFDDRKMRAADRVDVLISDNVEFARLKRLANDQAFVPEPLPSPFALLERHRLRKALASKERGPPIQRP